MKEEICPGRKVHGDGDENFENVHTTRGSHFFHHAGGTRPRMKKKRASNGANSDSERKPNILVWVMNEAPHSMRRMVVV